MGWTRPEQPPIPTVYHTFQAKDVDSDQLVTYRVEDLTADRHEDMIQHFLDHYIDDEPFCENRKLSEDDLALKNIIAYWHWCFAQQMTLVCYKEGSTEIVGANLLHVITPEKIDYEIESDRFRDVVEANEYMNDQCDLFEKYGVEKYLTAYGLAINRRYRGRGIATEMLRARVPLCKAFGIELTSTNFTVVESQRAAEKIGFVTDLELTYDDYAKLGPQYSFPGIKSKSYKLMSLKIE